MPVDPKMTVKPQIPGMPPAKKNKVAWTGGGAVAGFLVAGPIGALVGGGLGYLFSDKK